MRAASCAANDRVLAAWNVPAAPTPPRAYQPAVERIACGDKAIRRALAFVRWVEARSTPATPRDVQRRFGCSRATAYRWLHGYAVASGELDAR